MPQCSPVRECKGSASTVCPVENGKVSGAFGGSGSGQFFAPGAPERPAAGLVGASSREATALLTRPKWQLLRPSVTESTVFTTGGYILGPFNPNRTDW